MDGRRGLLRTDVRSCDGDRSRSIARWMRGFERHRRLLARPGAGYVRRKRAQFEWNTDPLMIETSQKINNLVAVELAQLIKVRGEEEREEGWADLRMAGWLVVGCGRGHCDVCYRFAAFGTRNGHGGKRGGHLLLTPFCLPQLSLNIRQFGNSDAPGYCLIYY